LFNLAHPKRTRLPEDSFIFYKPWLIKDLFKQVIVKYKTKDVEMIALGKTTHGYM
jgi:hypothetical protein